ncbi:MAG: hypothetical protein H0X71_11630 [Rubrobacter sp.]|nr:hypothetical protein [Rubrobacter sp.]
MAWEEAEMVTGGGACSLTTVQCDATRRTHDQGLMVYLWCDEDVHPRGAYQYLVQG